MNESAKVETARHLRSIAAAASQEAIRTTNQAAADVLRQLEASYLASASRLEREHREESVVDRE
jgi:hypothetical protein